ncbi:MAG: hypothetical protein QOJ11_2320 [Frankiales bacterium]|jgi:hypothetical protein|nr:hypothetical protein [Frankiales bacterium]
MGIGVSVFLIAVGAVLAFAVNAAVPNVDLVLVGVILMVAGAIGLLMSLAVWGPRRRAVPPVDPYSGSESRTTVRENMATPSGDRTVTRESVDRGY